MRLFQASHGDLVCATLESGSRCSSTRVDLGPIPRRIVKATPTSHKVLRDLGILRVAGLWAAEQTLEGYKSRFEGKHGAPRVLEDVEAYRARSAGYVWVVDFGDEFHLDGGERVRVGDDDVDVESATFIRRALGTGKGAQEVERGIVDE